MYGLLVLVVDGTDSSFMNSLFVVCAVIPAIVFGLPAGVVVDSMPKRMLLVTLNILRFVFVLSFALSSQSVAAIFAITLAIWIIHQFYAPAESATLASIVPIHRLTEAQAASNMALVTAQALGLIILAPILLKTSDPTYLFAICATLFLTASFLTMQLDRTTPLARRRKQVETESVGDTLLTGARVLFGDPLIFRVSTIDVIVGIGLSALVVIAPLYLRRILDTSSENTVFVFAPAAIGVILGLKAAPWLASRTSLRIVATAGLLVFAFSIAAFGFMNDIYDVLENTLGLPISNIAATVKIAPLALLVMLFSIPAGFSSSVVGVAARSVTLMRAPEESRGQVIATQSLAQNLGALLPTLLAGVAADAIGVERVAVAIAIIMLGTAAVAFLTQKQIPPLPSPTEPGMA